MSATVAAALKKIAIYILGDEKKRGKLFVLIGSIAAGFLGLMCLPVAVLSSMGSLEIETPEVDRSMFTDSAFMATLDEDQQSQIAEFQSQGEAIAAVMSAVGLPSETIKAQLIYYSYFDENPLSDFTEYASLFANANDDIALLESINATYGIEIPYDDFMRSYTWTMNATINECMFTDSTTKNCTDMTALSARETKITASDTAITQDLCLGISTTILRIKRLEMCMKFLFTRSKATLIPCPMLQALEYSTAHSMAFMLATARLFIRLPIAVMSQKNLFQTEIG